MTAYKFIVMEFRAGTQVRDQKQVLKQRLWEEWCVLACSPCSACLLIAPRPPAQGWHHEQGSGPSHINQQSMESLADMSTGDSSAVIVSKILSSQVDLVSCQNQKHRCHGQTYHQLPRSQCLVRKFNFLLKTFSMKLSRPHNSAVSQV